MEEVRVLTVRSKPGPKIRHESNETFNIFAASFIRSRQCVLKVQSMQTAS